MPEAAARPRGSSRSVVALLACLAFLVSLAYGAFLPLAPTYAMQITGGSDPAAVARHVGWLGGTYTFALFLLAPWWGRYSDRQGRRRTLLAGFTVFLVATLAGAVTREVAFVYAARFLAGAGAAAIVPGAQALIADFSSAVERSRRFVVLGASVFGGFLLGPVAGDWLTQRPMAMPLASMPAMANLPAVAVVALGALLLLAAFRWLPGQPSMPATPAARAETPLRLTRARKHFVAASLLLAMLASFAAGGFEVGFSLLAGQRLQLGGSELAAMFVTCGLAMLAAQGLLLFKGVRQRITPGWLAAAFLFSAAVLVFATSVGDAAALGLLILGAGTGIGLIGPVLSYELLERDRSSTGALLGRQAAAGNLGQAIGSASAGTLFAWSAAAPFAAAALVFALGALATLRWWGVARAAEIRQADARRAP